ncbi:putative zinc finger protein 286B [Erpetoichthys calabaricus]|uniref:Zinc finger protein 252-like n=1 Tax=Erpetoichthys calabaricus TaxID=27687 RepID=A0A8C4TJC1_ERPCA|nr:putative zinc finger protein 286B [Erpetoichthys calabaricus]
MEHRAASAPGTSACRSAHSSALDAFLILQEEIDTYEADMAPRGGRLKVFFSLVIGALRAAVQQFAELADRRFAELRLEMSAKEEEIARLRLQLERSYTASAATPGFGRLGAARGVDEALTCSDMLGLPEANGPARVTAAQAEVSLYKSTWSEKKSKEDGGAQVKLEKWQQDVVIKTEPADLWATNALADSAPECGTHIQLVSDQRPRLQSAEVWCLLVQAKQLEDERAPNGINHESDVPPVLQQPAEGARDAQTFEASLFQTLSENQCQHLPEEPLLWATQGGGDMSSRCPPVDVDTNPRHTQAPTTAPGRRLTWRQKQLRDQRSRAWQKCRTGRRFRCRGAQQAHEASHAGEKPHCCSECGKTFKRKSNLLQHQEIHTGEKPHRCGECGRTFTRKSNLQIHLMSHSGHKPYCCMLCGNSFTRKRGLQNHQKVHSVT